MYALIPILLILFVILYLPFKRKDIKTKTRIAWMLLISCSVIIGAGYQFLGREETMEKLWPFSLVVGICIIWLLALRTKK